MSDLRLRMQAFSDQVEKMLVQKLWIVRGPSSESSRRRCVHRTTNKPLNMVKRRQKGIEAWHQIVTRYDQRNTSDKNSEYAALIINISERD